MNFEDFAVPVLNATDPVILVEGRRCIPETSARSASRMASLLAERFPRLRFHSGNATVADEALASEAPSCWGCGSTSKSRPAAGSSR